MRDIVASRFLVAAFFFAQANGCALAEPPVVEPKDPPLKAAHSNKRSEDAPPPDAGPAPQNAGVTPRRPLIPECHRNERPADIRDEHICDDSKWKCTAPDCNGGTVEVPYWLRGVDLWNVLCVHAAGRRETVNFGDSVIEHKQAIDGDPQSQVYYALRQPPPIEVGEKRHVWAVCGGGGGQLTLGTRVLVGPGLLEKTAIELATIVKELEAYEVDLELFRGVYCGAPAQNTSFLDKIALMRRAINESTTRLRGALMTEHRILLSRSIAPPLPRKP